MNRIKKFSIVFGVIICLSNIWPISAFFKLFLDEKHYKYSNADGSNRTYEFMSRNFEMMKRMHKGCLTYNPEQKDKKMYRLFTKNPLAFWRWRLYFFDERYKLPYKNWKDIEKIKHDKPRMGCALEF